MLKKNRSIVFTLFCLLFVGVVSAQDVLQCSEMVRNFVAGTNRSCSGLNRDEICHGSTYALAEFFDSTLASEGAFDTIGDIISTSDVARIYTAEYNPYVPQWGVALLKAQANLPNTLPGQAIVFILMGDTELENAVAPDAQFESAARLPVRLESAASMRYAPLESSATILEIPAGIELLTDARSTDNAYVRVVYDDIAGWIPVSALDTLSRTSATGLALPVIGLSSMQAIYFETDFRGDICHEAPATLVIQGSRDYTIDIRVNDVNIRMGSTIALRTTAKENGIGMEILTIEGNVTVFPDTDRAVVIPPGYILADCIVYNEQDLADDGQFNSYDVSTCHQPRPLTAEEVRPLTTVAQISPDLLNYAIRLNPGIFDFSAVTGPELIQQISTSDDSATGGSPLIEQETTVPVPTQTACFPRSDWLARYTVVRGDTLSTIAQRAGVALTTFAAGNCISNVNTIFAGQELRSPVIIPLATLTPASNPLTAVNATETEVARFGIALMQAATLNAREVLDAENASTAEAIVREVLALTEAADSGTGGGFVTAIPTATLTPMPTLTPTATPRVAYENCYIEVSPGIYEIAPRSVLQGSNSGNFVWQTPTFLVNNYGMRRIWNDGSWESNFYGDCSPLGLGAVPPENLNIIDAAGAVNQQVNNVIVPATDTATLIPASTETPVPVITATPGRFAITPTAFPIIDCVSYDYAGGVARFEQEGALWWEYNSDNPGGNSFSEISRNVLDGSVVLYDSRRRIWIRINQTHPAIDIFQSAEVPAPGDWTQQYTILAYSC